jgi:proteasome activator subunit 4
MIPVLTSFLPPTHIHLYVPPLFKLWEAFNSNVTDERLIELCGELSEEHVAGKSEISPDGYGGAAWKDVGIWTEAEWTVLVGKALGSMSESLEYNLYYILLTSTSDVPVGVTRVS